MNSKVRQRPTAWALRRSATVSAITTAVLLVLLGSTSSDVVVVQAWQQPIRAVVSSRNTARQYATDTELVVAPRAAIGTVTAVTPKRVLVTAAQSLQAEGTAVAAAAQHSVTVTPRQKLPKQAASTTTRRRKKTVAVTQIPNARRVLQQRPLYGDHGALLSRAEEVLYTGRIRSLRVAIRQRDELTGKGKNNGNYNDSEHVVTETAWASACGMTVRELRLVLRDGKHAREVLVGANVGLVTSIAKQHHRRLKYATQADGGVGTILTLQDMIQEGNLGLLAAAERFCPERNVRFSTYAVYWIRQRISRAAQDSARVIRLPAHVHGSLSKVRAARIEFQTMQGRDPTSAELASLLDMSERKLQQLTQSSRNVVSLEYPLRGNVASAADDRRTIGESLRSEAPTPEENALLQYLKKDVQEVLQAALQESERTVLSHRFGLADGKSLSVQETADIIGWSRDKVRLIEARALNKLRHPQRNYRLKEYVTVSSSTTKTKEESPEVETRISKSRPKKKIWEESIWDTPVSKPTVSVEGTPSSAATNSPEENEQASASRQDRLWFF